MNALKTVQIKLTEEQFKRVQRIARKRRENPQEYMIGWIQAGVVGDESGDCAEPGEWVREIKKAS